MKPKDLEKSPECFASKDNTTFYACIVVTYLDKLDYIIGPFVSDQAALFWFTENKCMLGKGCAGTIELQVKPEEGGPYGHEDEDESS